MVFVVTGGEEFLRRRFMTRVIRGHEGRGWTVEYVDGEDVRGLRSAMTIGGSIFDTEETERKVLVVVSNPDKVDIDLLKKAKDESDVALLLDYPGEPRGNTRFGIFVKSLSKEYHSNHPKPAIWDAEKVAAGFCVSEAKALGKTLDPQLAMALVRCVGTELGFLAFEIQKMVYLANHDKSDVVTDVHVREAMAPLTQALITPLLDALVAKNRGKLLRALDRVKHTSKDDPTVRTVGFLWATAAKWLSVTDLRDKGISPEDAAARLKLNPWYYRNKLLPQVSRWNRKKVIRLISILAHSARTKLNGGVDAWAVLVAGLMRSVSV